MPGRSYESRTALWDRIRDTAIPSLVRAGHRVRFAADLRIWWASVTGRGGLHRRVTGLDRIEIRGAAEAQRHADPAEAANLAIRVAQDASELSAFGIIGCSSKSDRVAPLGFTYCQGIGTMILKP